MKTFNVKECVEKQVVRFGNGSIVYTPKKWIGKKVQVIMEQQPLNIRDEVLELVKPHLDSIECIFLYGSFARDEQTDDSDIDVMVISDKKFSPRKMEKFDLSVKTKGECLKEMEKDHTLFLHQIVKEAKPILNEPLLKELKQLKIKPNFKILFGDVLGAFKKVKELLDSNTDKEYLDSNTVIYSLILRLKGLFLVQCIKKKQEFSNKKFKIFLSNCGFDSKIIDNFLAIYRAERDDREINLRLSLQDAKKLFDSAKEEFIRTEQMVKK